MTSPAPLACPGASMAAAAPKALPVPETEPQDGARLADGIVLDRTRDPLFKPKGWALD